MANFILKISWVDKNWNILIIGMELLFSSLPKNHADGDK